ncbi:Pentatricopeptide repeat-containing protein At4g14850 [Linum grandiflorum]
MAVFSPNALASLLQSAVSTRQPLRGRATHAQIIKTLSLLPPHHLPAFLSNHLVSMYSKFDLPGPAELVLRLTPSRSVVTWTSLISGCVQNGHFSSALRHFSNMRRDDILPNDFTLPCAFKASAFLKLRFVGRQVHALSVKIGQISDVFVGSGAFDMYSKTGLIADAGKLFDEMPERNIVTWNAFISNAVLDGRPKVAIQTFIEFVRVGGEPDGITFCAFLNACADTLNLVLGKQLHGLVMRSGFETDVSVSNGLVDFYGKCKEVRLAEMIFDGMERRNLVSWGSMVATYEQNSEKEKACMVFMECRRLGVEPTDYLISSVVSACAELAGLDLGRSVHALAVKSCVDADVYVGSALVDMYGKCGSIHDADQTFRDMPEKNLFAWNAMISGYAHQGHADMAIGLFREMTSVVAPNYVTFVCVLSACSRGGAVESGMNVYESMRNEYGIVPGPEHYACVVDMLARSGLVERAYDFVLKLPIRPTISIWGALLNACRVHGKPEIGKIAADNLFKLDPKDSGNHVLLSNMFAVAGRWEEATLVRKEMNDVGIKKGAGCSWVTAQNRVHIFQAKDTFHERNSEIQEMLTELKKETEAAGYIPDTNYALFDLEEEEKKTEVWHHSEKIALAFGLIAIPPGVPIRITKNLRICGDCHSAFKLISAIVDREILVRDNNRFHRFQDGQCSCKDYW